MVAQIAQIASQTRSEVEYDVQVENGTAVDCSCPDRIYRHRTCKHMNAMNREIAGEINRAARFLAVRREVQGMIETWKCQYEMAFDSRF